MEELIYTLKKQIIEALNLEEVTPEDMKDNIPLFGGGADKRFFLAGIS